MHKCPFNGWKSSKAQSLESGRPNSFTVPASRSLSYLSLSSQANARIWRFGCQATVKVGLSHGMSAIFSPVQGQKSIISNQFTTCSEFLFSFHILNVKNSVSHVLDLKLNYMSHGPQQGLEGPFFVETFKSQFKNHLYLLLWRYVFTIVTKSLGITLLG